jgi:hypothetical protein
LGVYLVFCGLVVGFGGELRKKRVPNKTNSFDLSTSLQPPTAGDTTLLFFVLNFKKWLQ